MRVLVTGATGFLGGHILEALGGRAGIEPVAACRSANRLETPFSGEIRIGDLRDPEYRRRLLRGIDVVCHAGTWAAMWGHADDELARFYDPARALIQDAIDAGVGRFILASTIAVAHPAIDGGDIPDDARPEPTGFWPHLDCLVRLDHHMRRQAFHGTQMVVLRLGHFIGRRNRLGLVPALIPRLRTHLTPMLGDGRSRIPVIAGQDLGEAFACAATAQGLGGFESFNIRGPGLPTLREVVEFVADEAGCPRPHFRVPFWAGYAFGAVMEWLHPVLPGHSPFLVRSIVRLCENWPCSGERARVRLGYRPARNWHQAIRDQIAGLSAADIRWPRLKQS